MVRRIFLNIRNFIRFIMFGFIDLLILRKPINSIDRTILVVRLDGVGDFILFRNFIETLKESGQYKDYRLTLCGNITWKDLAERLDEKFIDNFIWIDRKRFIRNIFYRFSMLRKVNRYGFEIAIQPTFSREFFYGDAIIKISGAKDRIGNAGNLSNMPFWQKSISDRWYTKLLPANKENIFEFERNKEFITQLIKKDVDIKKPYINTAKVDFNTVLNRPYAVIFPGSGSRFRQWKIDNFAEIGDFLATKFHLDIVIAGSLRDTFLAKEIKQKTKTANILDLTSKTDLPQLAKLISKSNILISNETSAVHLAVAVNAKILCISNGNHLGRFSPYPENIYKNAFYIYPDVIMKEIREKNLLPQGYASGSKLDIDSIKVEDVKNLIERIL